MQDATKVVLGTTQDSDRDVSTETSDPASFPSGTVVQRDTTGALSTSVGAYVGISLGESLSDTKQTAVCRAGNRVPVLLSDESDFGFGMLTENDLTFTAKVLTVDVDVITVAFVDDATAGAETVDVTDKAIVVHMEDGASTATQLKTAIDASELAAKLISVSIAAGQSAVAQAAFAATSLNGVDDAFPYVVVGELVEVSTGVALTSGDATGAIWTDTVKIGVKLDGSLVPVGIVDMPGGL